MRKSGPDSGTQEPARSAVPTFTQHIKENSKESNMATTDSSTAFTFSLIDTLLEYFAPERFHGIYAFLFALDTSVPARSTTHVISLNVDPKVSFTFTDKISKRLNSAIIPRNEKTNTLNLARKIHAPCHSIGDFLHTLSKCTEEDGLYSCRAILFKNDKPYHFALSEKENVKHFDKFAMVFREIVKEATDGEILKNIFLDPRYYGPSREEREQIPFFKHFLRCLDEASSIFVFGIASDTDEYTGSEVLSLSYNVDYDNILHNSYIPSLVKKLPTYLISENIQHGMKSKIKLLSTLLHFCTSLENVILQIVYEDEMIINSFMVCGIDHNDKTQLIYNICTDHLKKFIQYPAVIAS